MNLFRIISANVLSFFFPDPCAVCGKPAGRNRYVCDRCKEVPIYIGRNSVCSVCLSPVSEGESLCGKCILKPPKYERLICAVSYDGEIKRSLHRYKFRGRSDLHSAFSKLLIERLAQDGAASFDAVVPVPLSKKRFRERGYNQSALIARDIAAHFSIPCIETALIRKKHTAPQSSLGYQYRDFNVRGAFFLKNPDEVRGKHVLLVDDIFTTGATVRDASRALKKSAKEITVCTVAKTEIHASENYKQSNEN